MFKTLQSLACSISKAVSAVPGENNECYLIASEAREICSGYSVDREWTEDECILAGCCWEQQINSSVPSCYHKGLQLSMLVKSSVSAVGYCSIGSSVKNDNDSSL